MDATFWHKKWENNEIAFHESDANPLLVKHFASLRLAQPCRVFLPLCGKTLDIAWLLSHGYHVVGAELSQLAVEQLFQSLGLIPRITQAHGLTPLTRYSAPHIDVFVGDIFALTQAVLGHVDAIYDRAALVALPLAVRQRYAAHLIEISQHAPQLLIGYEYDQALMNGPPFSIDRHEMHAHYQSHYHLTLLDSVPVRGGLKGQCESLEHVWLLTPP